MLFEPSSYDLTNGPDTADFSEASFAFDGDRTVSISFDGAGSIAFDNGAFTALEYLDRGGQPHVRKAILVAAPHRAE